MEKYQLLIGIFQKCVNLYYVIKYKIYIFRLLATISVLNNTVPQSVTSSRNNILIQFSAPARTNVFGLLRVTSGFGEIINLNLLIFVDFINDLI